VLIEARVKRADVAFRPRRQLVVHAEGVVLRFFNFYGSQLKQFQRAARKAARCAPSARCAAAGSAPRWRIRATASSPTGEPLPEALTPIYPTTAGVPQAALREKVLEALDAGALEDTLPKPLARAIRTAAARRSVRLLHRPPPGIDAALLAERRIRRGGG
jgi:ATP-dependent DNA helicase RecG